MEGEAWTDHPGVPAVFRRGKRLSQEPPVQVRIIFDSFRCMYNTPTRCFFKLFRFASDASTITNKVSTSIATRTWITSTPWWSTTSRTLRYVLFYVLREDYMKIMHYSATTPDQSLKLSSVYISVWFVLFFLFLYFCWWVFFWRKEGHGYIIINIKEDGLNPPGILFVLN